MPLSKKKAQQFFPNVAIMPEQPVRRPIQKGYMTDPAILKEVNNLINPVGAYEDPRRIQILKSAPQVPVKPAEPKRQPAILEEETKVLPDEMTPEGTRMPASGDIETEYDLLNKYGETSTEDAMSRLPAAGAPAVGRDAAAKYIATQGYAAQPKEMPALPTNGSGLTPDALQNYMQTLSKKGNPFADSNFAEALKGYSNGISFAPMGALADFLTGGKSKLIEAAKAIDDKNTTKDALIREEAKNLRQQKMIDTSIQGSMIKDLRKDVQPYKEILGSFDALKSTLTPDSKKNVNLQKVYASLTEVLSMMKNKGAVSDQDIYRTMFPTLQQYMSKVKGFFNKRRFVVKASEVQDIAEMVNDFKSAWNKRMGETLDITANSYVARGASKEFVEGQLANYKRLINDELIPTAGDWRKYDATVSEGPEMGSSGDPALDAKVNAFVAKQNKSKKGKGK